MPKLADEMGLSYSRFRDLLNGQHGTPTLSEFITICSFFGTDPAEELRAIEDKHDIAPKQDEDLVRKDIQELRKQAAQIEKMALHAAEQAAEIRAHPERFTLVAKRGDIEREQEMYNDLP